MVRRISAVVIACFLGYLLDSGFFASNPTKDTANAPRRDLECSQETQFERMEVTGRVTPAGRIGGLSQHFSERRGHRDRRETLPGERDESIWLGVLAPDIWPGGSVYPCLGR